MEEYFQWKKKWWWPHLNNTTLVLPILHFTLSSTVPKILQPCIKSRNRSSQRAESGSTNHIDRWDRTLKI
jgi:hypothetical protein